METLSNLSRRARMRLLRMHHESRVGHIGGNLSCIDILIALHHSVLGAQDALVLSKGHSAGALYVALWSVGRLTDDDLTSFHRDGTKLSGHPAPNWLPEIPFATGSLGHGLPLATGLALGRMLATGLALGRMLQGQSGRVFCVTSDGEWQEGSNWESLIFARRRGLAPLTVIVDSNKLQGFGTTADVADMEPLADRLRAFGEAVYEVDGHDPDAVAALCGISSSEPRVIIAHTVKGRGVSFMENRMEWHYLPMSDGQYQQALREVEPG